MESTNKHSNDITNLELNGSWVLVSTSNIAMQKYQGVIGELSKLNGRMVVEMEYSTMWTSTVQYIKLNENELHIRTNNSTYIFEKAVYE